MGRTVYYCINTLYLIPNQDNLLNWYACGVKFYNPNTEESYTSDY